MMWAVLAAALAAVFLLGFASVGAVLIPALSGAFGFFTMYTISCFVRCYGRDGVVLALGPLTVRLVFTLPCFLAVAGEAWPLSTELFLLALAFDLKKLWMKREQGRLQTRVSMKMTS